MHTNRPRTETLDIACFRHGLIALLFLTAACTTTRAEWAPILSEEAVVLDLPIVEQDELYACGLVSLTALCRYWGVTIPPDEQERLSALAREHKGLSGGDLTEALARRGFEAFLFEGTFDREPTGLFTQVDAGRPVMVMIEPAKGTNHYVLFLGYDDPQQSVCLLDPIRGRVMVPYTTFARTWESCDRFTLLAVPAENTELYTAASNGVLQ